MSGQDATEAVRDGSPPRYPADHYEIDTCGRCGRDDFFVGRVCAWCWWRPPCPQCGSRVDGRKDKVFCTTSCRKKWNRGQRGATPTEARRLLVSMDRTDLRSLLRRVMEEREPEGGRLKLRFGPYHPRK